MNKSVICFLVCILAACSAFASEDWTAITGWVSSVRNGQAATFYTITAEGGASYVANSATAQVGAHEAFFQQAYAEKKPLYIEFRGVEKHPDSMGFIRRIELVNGTMQTAPPAPVAERISVSGMFKDGMVLQRGMLIPVWGWAPPGTEVGVEFCGQKKTGKADAAGRWQAMLEPLEASFKAQVLTVVSAGFKLRVSNILVGEVWVLSGQSNMEWWLESADGGKQAAQSADCPWLRYFTPGSQLPETPAKDVSARAAWQVCSPKTAGEFSAVGFWMAQRLHAELNVPIGLIKNAVSGTYGECWVPLEVLKAIPAALPRLEEYQDALRKLPQEQARWKMEKAEWERQSAEAKKNGAPAPESSLFLRKGPMGPNHTMRPYALYNGLVAPLMPYAVRGVVWYQGEGNSQKQRAGYYLEILEGVVGSWRKGWQQAQLPFLIVQLPRFEAGANNDWPQVREAQRQAAIRLPDAHLVVTIDTGDEKAIHPTNKEPVANRVAALALQQIYGKAVQGRAPAPLSAEGDGEALLVRFSDVGGGLTARDGPPRCFEIAGSDGKFVPATAEIVAPDQIRLSASAVRNPAQIRYAYANVPDVNLFSGAGLPVVPFYLRVNAKTPRMAAAPKA